MRILSFDPGGTTGWAVFDDKAPEGVSKFVCGMIGPEEHHGKLWEFLHDEIIEVNNDLIVCESFQYRNGLDKAELISCEYIGLVKLYACDYGFDVTRRIIFQTASMGKLREPKNGKQGSFVRKGNLERLGLWSPGMIHAMDAYGHLLYYIINGGNPYFQEYRTKLLQAGWKE